MGTTQISKLFLLSIVTSGYPFPTILFDELASGLYVLCTHSVADLFILLIY